MEANTSNHGGDIILNFSSCSRLCKCGLSLGHHKVSFSFSSLMYAYVLWARLGYVVAYPKIPLDLAFLKVKAKFNVRHMDANEELPIRECLPIPILVKPHERGFLPITIPAWAFHIRRVLDKSYVVLSSRRCLFFASKPQAYASDAHVSLVYVHLQLRCLCS